MWRYGSAVLHNELDIFVILYCVNDSWTLVLYFHWIVSYTFRIDIVPLCFFRISSVLFLTNFMTFLKQMQRRAKRATERRKKIALMNATFIA